MANKTADRVDNGQDIIDSRDVIERIEELEADLQLIDCPHCDRGEIEDGNTSHECARCEGTGTSDLYMLEREHFDSANPLHTEHEDELEEVWRLRALLEEVEHNAGESARHGVCLIRDSYFETYARELADDIGATREQGWPNDFIDWERAADALKQDYSLIDYDGTEYWVRA